MTKAEAFKLLAVLKAAYPNHPIGAETLEVYAGMLADLDYDETQRAVRRLLAESKFFPTIAEIRQATIGVTLELPGAGEAWGEVMAAVRTVGSYGAPAWSTPALAQAVRAIGWQEICLTELEGMNTLRAHFFRVYEAYRDRARRDANWGALEPGAAERLPTGTDGPRHIGGILPFRRPEDGGES